MDRGNMVGSVLRSLAGEVGTENVARAAVSLAMREVPDSEFAATVARVMEVAPRSVPAGPWLRIHETMLRALLVEHGWELSSSQRVFESWTHDDWPTRRLIVPTEVAAPDYGSVVRDSFAAFVMLEHGSQAARIGLSVANSIAGGTA